MPPLLAVEWGSIMTDQQASAGAAAKTMPKVRRKADGGSLGAGYGTNGGIIIPREVFDRRMFGSEPYDSRSAMCWLIASARYAPSVFKTKKGLVRVGIGQLVAVDTHLAEAWGWERGRVRRFLSALTRMNIIRTDRGQGLQVVTLCNYEQYQRFQRGTGQDAVTARAQDAQNQNGRNNKKKESQQTGSAGPITPPSASDFWEEDSDDHASAPRERLLREGLPLLREISGKAQGTCRTFLGKLLKLAKDDDLLVLEALQQAHRIQPMDWKSWLITRCTPPKRRGHPGLDWMHGIFEEQDDGASAPVLDATVDEMELTTGT